MVFDDGNDLSKNVNDPQYYIPYALRDDDDEHEYSIYERQEW